MTVGKLINFLNDINLQELNRSLDELDKKLREINDIDSTIVNEIKDKNEEFFIWFCFLRANFLRGKDTISNRAFKEFIKFCEEKKNNYYFDKFPDADFLPYLNFQQAGKVERVLQQLREKYKSGNEFVIEIKELTDSFKMEEVHRLYLELISKLMSFEEIASKIANAVIGEILWELTLLRRSKEEKTFQNLLKTEWIRKLALASCFNVMIDTHVKNFFKENLKIKNVEHSILIFLGKSIRPEVVKSLFYRNFEWVKEGDLLLNNYHEYIGANMIEKLIWIAKFVKKNPRKNENINDLLFFKLSNDLF